MAMSGAIHDANIDDDAGMIGILEIEDKRAESIASVFIHRGVCKPRSLLGTTSAFVSLRYATRKSPLVAACDGRG